MAERKPKLDSGARGGLGGLVAVVALFTGLVAWYSARPLIFASLMFAAGVAGVLLVWRVAGVRRRLFSGVEWLVLSALLAVLFLVLRAAPAPQLQRYYDEDPSRQQTALLLAAVLAAVGLLSLWMLRGGKTGGDSSP